MSPTIRIDDEVYSWLQARAVPFNDTPNSVLRRLTGLDEAEPLVTLTKSPISSTASPGGSVRGSSGRRLPAASGDELREKWKIPAIQARFHHNGTFYARLTRFPAALCDQDGYVVFDTEGQYHDSPYLRVGKRVNVLKGISSIPGYVKVD
jgi:hypothetical protein